METTSIELMVIVGAATTANLRSSTIIIHCIRQDVGVTTDPNLYRLDNPDLLEFEHK